MPETLKTTSAKLEQQLGELFFLRDPMGMFRSVGKIGKVQGGWIVGNTFFKADQVLRLELDKLSIYVKGV